MARTRGKGFGTPGIDCPVQQYGAASACMMGQRYGSAYGPIESDEEDEEMYGQSDIYDSPLSEPEIDELDEIDEIDEYGLFEKLRTKWKKKHVERLVGRIQKVYDKGKEEKARKLAGRMARVIARLKNLDPDWETSNEIEAMLAFGRGEADTPYETAEKEEDAAPGRGGIFARRSTYESPYYVPAYGPRRPPTGAGYTLRGAPMYQAPASRGASFRAARTGPRFGSTRFDASDFLDVEHAVTRADLLEDEEYGLFRRTAMKNLTSLQKKLENLEDRWYRARKLADPVMRAKVEKEMSDTEDKIATVKFDIMEADTWEEPDIGLFTEDTAAGK